MHSAKASGASFSRQCHSLLRLLDPAHLENISMDPAQRQSCLRQSQFSHHRAPQPSRVNLRMTRSSTAGRLKRSAWVLKQGSLA